MKTIALTKGYVAQVDDADYEQVKAAGPWFAVLSKSGKIYAHHSVWVGYRSQEGMHRFVLGLIDGNVEGDHIDGDGRNNQRYNLRVATPSQNCQNRGMPSSNTSGYKGVSWHKNSGRWQATIKYGPVRKHLGYFDNVQDAAKAYDVAAQTFHGVFAKTNKTKEI
jgi:hypothetical protein